MIRTLLILVLLVAGFTLVFAPAAVLRHVVPREANVGLTGLSGTLWEGNADLLIGGRSAGRLAWQLAPVTVLYGALGYHLALSGPDQELEGDLALRPGGFELNLNGQAEGDYLNAWLERYDIQVSGNFAFESVTIAAPYATGQSSESIAAPGTANGVLNWTGGPVSYRLSGQDYAGALPPLEARFGDGLEAVVYASDGETPLLRAEILANGFVRLGITRLLTRLMNNPWPGGDADHEVVLEVEEQLL